MGSSESFDKYFITFKKIKKRYVLGEWDSYSNERRVEGRFPKTARPFFITKAFRQFTTSRGQEGEKTF